VSFWWHFDPLHDSDTGSAKQVQQDLRGCPSVLKHQRLPALTSRTFFLSSQLHLPGCSFHPCLKSATWLLATAFHTTGLLGVLFQCISHLLWGHLISTRSPSPVNVPRTRLTILPVAEEDKSCQKGQQYFGQLRRPALPVARQPAAPGSVRLPGKPAKGVLKVMSVIQRLQTLCCLKGHDQTEGRK